MPLALVTLILVICLFESFTKGWVSFMIVPFSIVILPLVRVLHGKAFERFGTNLGILRSIQIYSILAFYVFLVGINGISLSDNPINNYILFGFYETTDEQIATISKIISLLAGMTALLATADLINKTYSKAHVKPLTTYPKIESKSLNTEPQIAGITAGSEQSKMFNTAPKRSDKGVKWIMYISATILLLINIGYYSNSGELILIFNIFGDPFSALFLLLGTFLTFTLLALITSMMTFAKEFKLRGTHFWASLIIIALSIFPLISNLYILFLAFN